MLKLPIFVGLTNYSKTYVNLYAEIVIKWYMQHLYGVTLETSVDINEKESRSHYVPSYAVT